MSDTALRDLVLARLEKDTQPEDEWSALVLAALEGAEDLAQLLTDGNAAPRAEGAPKNTKAPEPSSEAPRQAPKTAFLRRLTAEGFRGIGPKATLDLTPGPGLTLVVGRNGSGKSSFAEGLELLLTGDTYRWSQRSKIWRDGWRNLHHPKAALAAEFALEGETGACTLAREWADGAELTGASTWAQVHGQPRGPEALGWETPSRPTAPSSPTTSSAPSSTRAPPSSTTPSPRSSASTPSWTPRPPSSRPAAPATRRAKDADQERKALLARLEDVEGERAERVTDALSQKDWDLETLEAELKGPPTTPPPDSQIDLLKRLAALQPPTRTPSPRPPGPPRRRQAPESRRPDRSGEVHQLATLLDHALRFHNEHGNGDCPVCGHGTTTGGIHATSAA